MAGRRLAVGVLEIVPGVFPAGAVTPMKPAALHLTVSMALVVSTKQPFLVMHFRREAAEALKARYIPAQGKRAESARRPG